MTPPAWDGNKVILRRRLEQVPGPQFATIIDPKELIGTARFFLDIPHDPTEVGSKPSCKFVDVLEGDDGGARRLQHGFHALHNRIFHSLAVDFDDAHA